MLLSITTIITTTIIITIIIIYYYSITIIIVIVIITTTTTITVYYTPAISSDGDGGEVHVVVSHPLHHRRWRVRSGREDLQSPSGCHSTRYPATTCRSHHILGQCLRRSSKSSAYRKNK